MRPVSTKTQVSWSADGLVDQGGRHGRVDPAGQPAQDPSSPTWARTAATCCSMIDPCVHEGRHPQASSRKCSNTSLPRSVWTTSGWNCGGEDAALIVVHGGDRGIGAGGGGHEARRRVGDGVAVAHPDVGRRRPVDAEGRRAAVDVSSVRPYSPRGPVAGHLPPSCRRDELGAGRTGRGWGSPRW